MKFDRSFLLFARRKHQIEVIAHILVQISQSIFVTAEIQVDSVQVVIVSVDIIVNVQDEGDYGRDKAHVTESI